MLKISEKGLTEALGQNTLHSHPWNRENLWVLCPDQESGWGETPKDSRWTLEPPTGQMYVATHCYIQCSCDVLITPAKAMIVEGYFGASDETPYEITRFSYLDIMTNRAHEKKILDPSTGHAGGSEPGMCMTKKFYDLKIPFAEEVLIWSSADGTIMAPSLDQEGKAKFRRMVVRIADDEPYKDSTDALVETALSRYLCDVYTDPDYVEP